MEKTNHETRQFRMHNKLLMDVITRQAGSLPKAILEAVMNSIDACGTKCEVQLTTNKVVISDDGRGFRSRDEIEKFFEVFGQPHSESEGKTYGTFRMGRGQMFAFGRNRWASGTFRMDIDIKERGLDYSLDPAAEFYAGCRIEIDLYEPLRPVTVLDMERELGQLVRYAPVPVLLNGRNLSEDAGSKKWPLIIDEAYMKIDVGGTSGLKVYNLGVHVADLSSYTYGCSGVIVSRKQLAVNFARNDLMSTDPVSRKILTEVRKLVNTGVAHKKKLTPSERSKLFRNLLSGEVQWTDYMEAKLFSDCTGRGWSYRQLTGNRERFGGAGAYAGKAFYSFASRNSHDGDRVMQHNLALVLDEEMLDVVGVKSPEEFFKVALANVPGYSRAQVAEGFVYAPLTELSKELSGDGYHNVGQKEWTKKEKLVMITLEGINNQVLNCVHERGVDTPVRQLRIGEAESSLGWTDGETYISLRRDVVNRIKPGAGGFMEAVCILLHEYCHTTNDIGDHVHDEEFYRLYHDASMKLGNICTEAARGYLRVLRNASSKLPAQAARVEALDQEAADSERRVVEASAVAA